jgi:taurine dioxygenase
MLDVHPLSDGFGAEIHGVDLAQPLSDALFREVERVFYNHQVLALRAQTLTPAQFVAFARRIGPPQPHVIDQFHHPQDANILILSNAKVNGEPTGLQDAGSYFHTDYSYLQVPARATTLYSPVVPQVGGDTLFANQIAAYDDLPDAMKRRIEPLRAVHHYGNRHDVNEASRTAASPLTDGQKAKMPVITHRVARPHPITGRKAPYAVSGSSFGIVGMPDDEARGLLDELATHATQPKYQLRFKYGVGRRRGVGQRGAAALGHPHRPQRRAHAVAHHGAGVLGGRGRARCVEARAVTHVMGPGRRRCATQGTNR